jgi:hypothetical protein
MVFKKIQRSKMNGKKASEKASGIPSLASLARLDASMTEDLKKDTFRPCECGCGRFFKPTRKHQRFFDDHCRKRAWINRNAGPVAISKIRKDHDAILARLDRIEEKLGMKGERLASKIT